MNNSPSSPPNYPPNMSDRVVYYGALAAGALVTALNFDQGLVISMGLSWLGAAMGWVLLTLGLVLIGQPPNAFYLRYLDRIKTIRK